MNRRIRNFGGMTADPKGRRLAKALFKQTPALPLPSLADEPRIGNYSDNYEAFSEYGFLPERYNAWSDEEIEECIDDMVEYVTGPYDCTGKRFTMWITWHRNPGGRISYVHRFGIDV